MLLSFFAQFDYSELSEEEKQKKNHQKTNLLAKIAKDYFREFMQLYIGKPSCVDQSFVDELGNIIARVSFSMYFRAEIVLNSDLHFFFHRA